ncbi:MAG: DUF4351 domain-containing protein [Magnetococcales bacterium]|nr:DUF4351 domain-containing protein [Magnetococcales bacterium]
MKALMDGEQKGERQEAAKILSRLLQHRFGTMPDWASDKVASADLLSLETWSLRFVDAQSLDNVFSDGV